MELLWKSIIFALSTVIEQIKGVILPYFFAMLKDSLRDAISDHIIQNHPDVFIVDMKLNRGKQSVLGIKVDTDKGISLSECVEISRSVGRFLEENEEMDFQYNLEVSSPGVGYPLSLHRQYVNNKGRFLQVLLEDGTDTKGKLTEVTEEYLVLEAIPQKRKKGKKKSSPPEDEQKEKLIKFSEIKEAKVIIV